MLPQSSGGRIKLTEGRIVWMDARLRSGPHLWSGVLGAASAHTCRPGTPRCSPGGLPGGGTAPIAGARSAKGESSEAQVSQVRLIDLPWLLEASHLTPVCVNGHGHDKQRGKEKYV